MKNNEYLTSNEQSIILYIYTNLGLVLYVHITKLTQTSYTRNSHSAIFLNRAKSVVLYCK